MIKGAKYKTTFITFFSIVMLVMATSCASSGSSSGTSVGAAGTSTGSAGSTKGTTASSSQPSTGGKAPIVTALLSTATDFPADNPVIQEIRKESGVDLEVQTVNNDQYKTRLNTLIVSGQIPDVFDVDKSQLPGLVANKAILPLDDLLKKDGTDVLQNRGQYLKGPAFINGKVYGLPGGFVPGSALAIRQDWLNKLHLKVPTTLDQLETVLKAFVNNDPDGNGKKDTIGLGVAIKVDPTWQAIFGAFNVPMNQQMLENGKVVPWMLDPGYLDAVKYLNKLYNEGLLDPEFDTVPTLQSFQKLWNGKVGAYNFNADGTTQNWLSRYVEKPAPQFVYTVIKGPNGYGGYPKEDIADSGSFTVISSKAKNPEAAMKLINFLVSKKGDALTWAGIKGTTYKYVNGQFQWIPPYDDAVKLRDYGGYMYSVLINRINGMRESLFNKETQQGRKIAMDNQIDSAYIYQVPKIEIDRGSTLTSMEQEFRTKAIMAKPGTNLDQMYAQFKANYLQAGGSTWIQQATQIYNEEQAARK